MVGVQKYVSERDQLKSIKSKDLSVTLRLNKFSNNKCSFKNAGSVIYSQYVPNSNYQHSELSMITFYLYFFRNLCYFYAQMIEIIIILLKKLFSLQLHTLI